MVASSLWVNSRKQHLYRNFSWCQTTSIDQGIRLCWCSAACKEHRAQNLRRDSTHQARRIGRTCAFCTSKTSEKRLLQTKRAQVTVSLWALWNKLLLFNALLNHKDSTTCLVSERMNSWLAKIKLLIHLKQGTNTRSTYKPLVAILLLLNLSNIPVYPGCSTHLVLPRSFDDVCHHAESSSACGHGYRCTQEDETRPRANLGGRRSSAPSLRQAQSPPRSAWWGRHRPQLNHLLWARLPVPAIEPEISNFQLATLILDKTWSTFNPRCKVTISQDNAMIRRHLQLGLLSLKEHRGPCTVLLRRGCDLENGGIVGRKDLGGSGPGQRFCSSQSFWQICLDQAYNRTQLQGTPSF